MRAGCPFLKRLTRHNKGLDVFVRLLQVLFNSDGVHGWCLDKADARAGNEQPWVTIQVQEAVDELCFRHRVNGPMDR